MAGAAQWWSPPSSCCSLRRAGPRAWIRARTARCVGGISGCRGALEILAGDFVQGALTQPEPDDALLRLQANDAIVVERGHDRRVLLRAAMAHDRLACPEDVGRELLLLLLHTGGLLLIVGDACARRRPVSRARRARRRQGREGGLRRVRATSVVGWGGRASGGRAGRTALWLWPRAPTTPDARRLAIGAAATRRAAPIRLRASMRQPEPSHTSSPAHVANRHAAWPARKPPHDVRRRA